MCTLKGCICNQQGLHLKKHAACKRECEAPPDQQGCSWEAWVKGTP